MPKYLKYIKCHLTVKQVNLVKLLLLFQLYETNYCTELNYRENQLQSNQYNQICITIHTLNQKVFSSHLQLIFKKGLTWHCVLYLKAIFSY